MEMNLYGFHVLKMEQDGSIKYNRYAFSRNGWNCSQTKNEETGEITGSAYGGCVFTETMPSIEINSIKKYGGFYIGRYEVGIVNYDTNVITSNTNKETEWTGYHNGTAVVQADRQVWNYITRDKAIEIAEEMYHNNDVVVSRLCSSYAWDTTLKFIETSHVGYATNSEGDNYSGALKHTGIGSTPRNNIYDIGGNVAEWTTEVYSDQTLPCVVRGGGTGTAAGGYPASCRDNHGESNAFYYISFRCTLFVGL